MTNSPLNYKVDQRPSIKIANFNIKYAYLLENFDFCSDNLPNIVSIKNNPYVETISLAPLISEPSSKYSYVIGSNSTNLIVSQHRTELDSHADTCTVGKNALITHIHNRSVTVHAYDPSLGTQQDKSIVNAAVAYDCPHTGEILICKLIKQYILIL